MISWPLGGSSPLTRGKPSVPPTMWYTERLIPAHAGKTMLCARRFLDTRAHPRSRGENNKAVTSVKYADGSSPLTRGKQGIERQLTLLHRLIPAHAGKTPQRTRAPGPREAHPRSRGENLEARR